MIKVKLHKKMIIMIEKQWYLKAQRERHEKAEPLKK